MATNYLKAQFAMPHHTVSFEEKIKNKYLMLKCRCQCSRTPSKLHRRGGGLVSTELKIGELF